MSIPVRFVEHYRVRVPCKDGTHPEGDWEYGWRLPGGPNIDGPQPGDAFWSMPHERPCSYWDNCEGRHLIVILPDGHHWNVDGRASNCTLPDDRLHRCWVRHGDPAVPGSIHVDKAGLTCQAGAGSILSGSYHGFLHHGALT